jgi:hypothetical protein
MSEYNQGQVSMSESSNLTVGESPTTVVLSPVDPVVAITRAGDTFGSTAPRVARALYTGLDSPEAHVIYDAAGQLFVVTGNLVVSLLNAAYNKVRELTKK